MIIKSYNEPHSHILIEDFLPKFAMEYIYNTIIMNEKDLVKGQMMKDNGQKYDDDKKENRTLDIGNDMMSILQRYLFSDQMRTYVYEHRNVLFRTLLDTNAGTGIVSIYNDGDYYKWHIDFNRYLTCSLQLCHEPRTFTGGDFMLKYKDEIKTIPFKNNLLIIFPSSAEHSVSVVHTKTKKLEDARMSVQYWCYRQ